MQKKKFTCALPNEPNLASRAKIFSERRIPLAEVIKTRNVIPLRFALKNLPTTLIDSLPLFIELIQRLRKFFAPPSHHSFRSVSVTIKSKALEKVTA